MKHIYYFQKNDLFCYEKEYHLNYMRENDLKKMVVYKAKIERGTGLMYCKLLHECGESADVCGLNNCARYSPRNKKNGICKFHGYCYSPSNEEIILKIR